MLAKQVYHTACRISYRVSDISLKYTTNCNIIMAKEGAFMSENKLLDLSFEFAVAIVNLVDGVTAPKVLIWPISLQERVHRSVPIFTKHSTRRARKTL